MPLILPDDKPINYKFMERYTENLDLAIREYIAKKIEEGSKSNLYSQVLIAGETSVTFEVPLGNYIIEVFNSKDGLDYVSLDDSQEGFITVVFEEQTENVGVYLRLESIETEEMMLSQVLVAGQTSVTFTNIPLTDCLIEIFTSKDGLDYVSLNDSVAGILTITFDVQPEDVTIYLKISDTTES